MFPLGHPLIPFTIVPLRIFEPRYLQMIAECLEDQEPFGVVMIEQGSEVGGGDRRSSVGTVAQIVEATDLEEGHQAVVAVGVERLDVVSWLDDDPYPQAIVQRTEEADAPEAADRIDHVDQQLRAVLALVSEAGTDVGPLDYQLSNQPQVAAHQMCGLAPIGPYDAQQLLTCTTTDERLTLLESLLNDQREILTKQLGGG